MKEECTNLSVFLSNKSDLAKDMLISIFCAKLEMSEFYDNVVIIKI